VGIKVNEIVKNLLPLGPSIPQMMRKDCQI
jgi:hypothetical protein